LRQATETQQLLNGRLGEFRRHVSQPRDVRGGGDDHAGAASVFQIP
jgi:hypothetical protein